MGIGTCLWYVYNNFTYIPITTLQMNLLTFTAIYHFSARGLYLRKVEVYTSLKCLFVITNASVPSARSVASKKCSPTDLDRPNTMGTVRHVCRHNSADFSVKGVQFQNAFLFISMMI